jgi:hypothetical protein
MVSLIVILLVSSQRFCEFQAGTPDAIDNDVSHTVHNHSFHFVVCSE